MIHLIVIIVVYPSNYRDIIIILYDIGGRLHWRGTRAVGHRPLLPASHRTASAREPPPPTADRQGLKHTQSWTTATPILEIY